MRLKLDLRPMQFSVTNTKVKAVLGPTNTGKTYLAMERLLAHGSGMIGFPLRLLARENYDRAVAIKGPSLCCSKNCHCRNLVFVNGSLGK